MPFYYGKSEDGSDMKEFEGFPVSDCGEYWGTTKELANQSSKIDKKLKLKERIKNLQNNGKAVSSN